MLRQIIFKKALVVENERQISLKKENVSLYFFELYDAKVSSVAEIMLSDKGRVLNYRKGLFNHFDDDLNVLLGGQFASVDEFITGGALINFAALLKELKNTDWEDSQRHNTA